MELSATYRCRICGKTYTDSATGSQNTAKRAVLEVAFGIRPSDPLSPHMFSYHVCEDGSIGLSDFLGFQAEHRKPPLGDDGEGQVSGLLTEVEP